MDIQKKREREKQMVSEMIRLYCRKRHRQKTLCTECKALEEYARQRSDKCPFMENKTFCSNCKVHCYKPEMREKIREVMRLSGEITFESRSNRGGFFNETSCNAA